MVLDTSLLNTQTYKVRIKGKVEQSKRGVPPSPIPQCSGFEKEAFWSPSTTVANFTYSLLSFHFTENSPNWPHFNLHKINIKQFVSLLFNTDITWNYDFLRNYK